MQHVDELLLDPHVATNRVTLYVDTSSSAKGEDVLLKAALLYLKGNLFSDLGNYVSARQCFLEALKLEPEFGLALTGFNEIKNK
jgi:tetratricopeptide (TPR) repeat protein